MMAHQNGDVRTIVSSWARGRRGFTAGTVAALLLVVLAVARFAPPADVAVAEAPGTETAAPALDSAALAAAVVDSIAAADAAAADSAAAAEPAILMADASTEEMFGFSAITDGVPRVERPAVIRGLYLNAYAAGSDAKLDRLIRIANDTEIN